MFVCLGPVPPDQYQQYALPPQQRPPDDVEFVLRKIITYMQVIVLNILSKQKYLCNKVISKKNFKTILKLYRSKLYKFKMTGIKHSVLIFLDDDRQSFRICSDESSSPSYHKIESHYSITYEWAWIKYVARKFLENIFCKKKIKIFAVKLKKLWRVFCHSSYSQAYFFLLFQTMKGWTI